MGSVSGRAFCDEHDRGALSSRCSSLLATSLTQSRSLTDSEIHALMRMPALLELSEPIHCRQNIT